MLTATPTHVQHALSLPPQSQLTLVNNEGTPVHSYRKKSIEHACGNNNGKAQTTTYPLRACRRLEKRNSSRLQSSANDTITATYEDSNNEHPKESLLASGKYGTVSAPMVRSRTLDTRTERVMEQCRRSSAPPVMQDAFQPSRGPEAESSSHEKVEKWLKTQSREHQPQPQLGSSAPPRLVVQPPDEISPTEEAKERYWPFSSPVCQYQASGSLCVPGSTQVAVSGDVTDEVRSPSQDSNARTWRVTVGNKRYEVPDVTNDIADVVKREGDEGGFGYVRRGKLNGQDIALKEIKVSGPLCFEKKSEMKKSKRYRREVAIAMKLAQSLHPNIMKLIGIAISDVLGACLVFPWMANGDSLSYVRSNDVPRIPLIRGTLEGLRYLHRRGFVHGDLKARNVLISDEGTPLICDFGLSTSTELDDEQPSKSIQRAGNAQWMAPETLMDDVRKWTRKSDMWAFGMYTIEILTGDLPFPNGNGPSILLDIERGSLPLRPTHPECSDALWGLIQDCWEKSPEERITAKAALDRINEIGIFNGNV